MAGMLKRVAPLSYEAWIDYDVCGMRLSRMELDALRQLVSTDGERLRALPAAELGPEGLEQLGLSKREAGELVGKLGDTAVPDFELDLSRAKPASFFEERFAAAVAPVDRNE
jgi:hypothetical protein